MTEQKHGLSDAEQKHGLSDAELGRLRMFGPDTYSIFFAAKDAKSLEDKGLITWVPPMFGGISYRLTDAGRALRDQLETEGA